MSITFDDRATFAALKGYGKRIGYSSLERMRDALEEALPHLRVQETPACAGHCYSMTESGAGYIDPDCPKHAAPHLRPVVPDLAGALRQSVDAARARRLGRPVVDREALIEALGKKRCVQREDGEDGSWDFPGYDEALQIAEVVLALLPTEDIHVPDVELGFDPHPVALCEPERCRPTEEGEGSEERNDTHPVGRRSQPGIHHADDCPMRHGFVTTGCFCGREGERDS